MPITSLGKGTFTSALSAAITIQPPAAATAIGDLLIVVIENANQTTPIPNGGWKQVPNSPQFTGPSNSAGGVRVGVFYRFVTTGGAQPSVSYSSTGNHQSGIMCGFRGVDTENPFAASAGAVNTPASTAFSLPEVITDFPQTAIFFALALDKDLAATDNLSAWTNSNLSAITEIHDETVTTGTGGGIGIAWASFYGHGSTGTTSVTSASATVAAFVTLALKAIGPLPGYETGSDTFAAYGGATAPETFGTLTATETGSDTFVADALVLFPYLASTAVYGTVTNAITSLPVTGILQVRTDANGDLFFSGDMTFAPQGTTNNTYTVELQWQYRTVGGAWVDLFPGGGSGIASVQPAIVAGNVLTQVGFINVASSITTLDANRNYEVQLWGERSAGGAIGSTIELFAGTTDATVTAIGVVSTTGNLSVIELGGDTFLATGINPSTGNLIVSETGADTFASTAKVLVQATLNATEVGSDTFSGIGQVLVKGSLAVSETGSDTLVSDGDVLVKATLAVTEVGSDTFSATAKNVSTANLSVTETGQDSFASTGQVLVQGALNATEVGSDTFAGTAGSIITSTATLNATEVGSDSFASTAKVLVKGALAVTEAGSDLFTSTGKVVVQATLNVSEVGSDTFAVVAKNIAKGFLSVTETGSDTFVGVGKVIVKATLNVTESGSDVFAGTANVVGGGGTNVFFGEKTISSIYFGNKQIVHVYHGDKQIF